jgi:hypothetical protein
MAKSKKGKKKSKKKKVKVYKPESSKYRKPEEKPPEGFELLEQSTDTLTQARDKIHNLLQYVCETITVACWFRTQSYPKANEVDGWLVVSGVKGIDTPNIVSMIQEAMLPDAAPDTEEYGRSILGRGYWISVGFRWQGTGSEDEIDQYKKWHGMVEVSSHYRSMSDEKSKSIARSKVLSAFSVGILPSSRNPNTMISNIEKKFNRTIGEIFVKVVWNAKNSQPLRSEPEEKE